MRYVSILMVAVLGLGLCGGTAGAAFVPSDIPGLQLWFNAGDLTGLGAGNNPAGGTAVGTWADLGGSGLDATQTNAARQPIYRSTVAALGYMPAVDFNGTSHGLNADAFSSGNVRTAFVVTVPRASQSAWPWVVAQIDTAYGGNDAWGIGVASATKFRASWRHAGNGHGSSNQATNFVANVPYVLGYVSDVSANEGTLYVNGGAMTPGTTVHQTLDQGLGIGATFGSSSYWYNGEIAEVILYNTALGTEDLAAVQTYLTQKYWMAPVYYDTSSDNGLQGGSAVWNAANTLWSSSTAGTDPTAWNPSSDAVFHSSLSAGTITIGENINANSVTIQGATITLASIGGNRVSLGGGLAITAGAGGMVTINAGVLAGTGGLILDRSGANQRIYGDQSFTGQVQLLNGTLRTLSLANFGANSSLGQGTSGTPIILGSPGGIFGSIWHEGGSMTTNRTFRLANGGYGSIATNSGSITLNGAIDGGSETSMMRLSSQASHIMTLNAQSTYLGATHIYGAANSNSGIVRLGIDNALPTTTSLSLGFVVGSNQYSGLLDLNGFSQELAGLFRYAGATGPYIHLFNSSSVQSTLPLNIASGTNTYEGVIGRSGGNNLGLVKTGEGILELSGANTYSGATAVRNGTLRIGVHNALPTSTTVTLGLAGSDNTALLDLNGFNQQLAGLVRTGLSGAETNVFNSDTITESTLTLDITSGTNTFAGVIGRDGGDNLGLTKTGAGQLQLSGVNTYTGPTTISRGVMRISVLADFGMPSSLGKGTEGTPIVLGSAGGNLGSIWHTGGNMSTNRTFYVAVGGIGSIGTNSGSITLNGVIEGGSATSLMRLSSQATHVMTLNAQSTYSGATHIYGAMNANNGIVRLGIDNALPVTTSLSLGFVSGSNQYAGLFDLNGFNQELAGLARESGTSPYLNVYNSNTTSQSTLTLNIASGTSTYDGVIGRAGGNNLSRVKTGEGAMELLGDNTYTGTTTVVAGLLSVPGSLANIGPADIRIHSAGTAFGANDPRIALAVGNGVGYGMGSAIVGGDHATTAELLGGTAGADRTVAMAWRQGAGGEEGELISNVLSLEGTGDDTYVLQMSYNANWGASAYLAWLDGDQWINAVAGNTGGTPTFFDAAYDAGDHFTLGYYGVDTTNHLAWAVLNHNSQFAVVPEPGTALMLLTGGAALVLAGFRKRRHPFSRLRSNRLSCNTIEPVRNRRMTPLNTRLLLIIVVIGCSLCGGAATAGIITSDSFDRPTSSTLGSTDNALGGSVTAPWQERAAGGGLVDTSDILDSRLRVFGEGGYSSTNSNPGFAVINYNLPADYLNVSMDVRFDDLVGSGSTLKNALCLRLRMPSAGASIYDSGEIHVQFGPNGYLSLRERVSSTWNQLYNSNPFTDTNTGWNVGPGGSLPSTLGGMPFDLDGSGTLDFDEPFTLGAILYGTELSVLLNGVNVATVTAAAAPGSNNYFSLGKNRVSSANTLTTPAVYFDNLVIVPEPGALLLLAMAGLALPCFRRRRRR